MSYSPLVILLIALTLSAAPSAAQRNSPGPVIHSAGAIFDVPSPSFVTPTDIEYKIVFEVSQAASSPDRINSGLGTVARFINMHAANGVPLENIHAAVVVHGSAGWDLLADAGYREQHGVDNPNAELIRELIAAGTQVVLCGQTAGSRGIPQEGLIDGVQMALSAITALYVLQQDGYRVNLW